MSDKSVAQTKYWFKRRRYGWGWIPVTWQGWVAVIAFLIVVLTAVFQLPVKPDQPSSDELKQFVGTVSSAIIALLIVSYLKGPTPRWRWGQKSDDDPSKDF